MLVAISIALAVALILLVQVYSRLQKARDRTTVHETERAADTAECDRSGATLEEKIRGLEQDRARLGRFATVAGADDAAKRLLAEAGQRAVALESQTSAAREEALKAAAGIRASVVTDATARAMAIRAEAKQLRDTAARTAGAPHGETPSSTAPCRETAARQRSRQAGTRHR